MRESGEREGNRLGMRVAGKLGNMNGTFRMGI